MTIELEKLETLAKAAGGDAWTPTYATTTGLATVWLPDGDSVCRCYGNIGHWPEAIDADDVAEYIAAASPAAILELCAEVRAWRKRFPINEYRAQDESIVNLMWENRHQPKRDCPQCHERDIPVGVYCKGINCPLNPSATGKP